ncbi:Methyltransferase small domain-containing protein [Pseudovibrio axinellae]|nr:Methyltransferase small domain-containing protein [Pseudovibrio axinellae]
MGTKAPAYAQGNLLTQAFARLPSFAPLPSCSRFPAGLSLSVEVTLTNAPPVSATREIETDLTGGIDKMAKLTKAQSKAHFQAEEILKKDVLSEEDKEFVFANWHEGAEFENGSTGAFFTPEGLAWDFTFDVSGHKIIDLCAGIGMLAYATYHRLMHRNGKAPEITCIERNPRYVEVGKKLLPEATWICADVFDWQELNLGKFDRAISNPPFGKVKRFGRTGPSYKGALFELHVMDIASELANEGTFIIPQNSASFKYSGVQCHSRDKKGAGVEFQNTTGFYMSEGCGIDTSCYRDMWKGVNPLCEIVTIDYAQARQQREAQEFPLFALAA